MAWDRVTQHKHINTLHLGPVTALISSLICVGVWWTWNGEVCGSSRCLLTITIVTSSPLPKLVTAQWAMVQVLTHDSCQGSVKLVTSEDGVTLCNKH